MVCGLSDCQAASTDLKLAWVSFGVLTTVLVTGGNPLILVMRVLTDFCKLLRILSALRPCGISPMVIVNAPVLDGDDEDEEPLVAGRGGDGGGLK
eukprot:COSAG01_NODE_503_length_16167_cov_10.407230_22_plen_95_part_00